MEILEELYNHYGTVHPITLRKTFLSNVLLTDSTSLLVKCFSEFPQSFSSEIIILFPELWEAFDKQDWQRILLLTSKKTDRNSVNSNRLELDKISDILCLYQYLGINSVKIYSELIGVEKTEKVTVFSFCLKHYDIFKGEEEDLDPDIYGESHVGKIKKAVETFLMKNPYYRPFKSKAEYNDFLDRQLLKLKFVH